MTLSPIEGATATVGIVSIAALSFTPSDVNTAIIGLTGFVTAVGIVIVNIMHARTAAKEKAEAKKTAEETLEKVKIVEHATNSASTKAEGIISSLEIQLAMLRETITKQDQTAALLAARAVATPAQREATVATPAAAAPILESINDNTAATAKNTARTDAAVSELKKDQP